MTSGPKDILAIKDGAAWLASALIINFLIWSNLFQRSGEALSATNLVLPLMISAVAFCLWRAKREAREEGTWLPCGVHHRRLGGTPLCASPDSGRMGRRGNDGFIFGWGGSLVAFWSRASSKTQGGVGPVRPPAPGLGHHS